MPAAGAYHIDGVETAAQLRLVLEVRRVGMAAGAVGQDGQRPDLRNRDFRGEDLSGVDFKGADLFGDVRERALAYCDDIKEKYFETIRDSVDKLELMVDDEDWPLAKYRELLFLR